MESTPTRTDFAQQVIAEMRATGPHRDITHDEIAVTRVHPGRGPFEKTLRHPPNVAGCWKLF